jgi:CheY-like chemotaxis protein/tetratricopeptide (TPR) repeat protein
MSATILCAQDDRQLHEIHEQALCAAGHRVISAHDGEQVLLSMEREAPDLLLLDVALPKLDGLQALKQIRSRGGEEAGVPIILLCSGRVPSAYRERIERLGATRVLSKPVALETLMEEISQLVKSRPPSVNAEPGPTTDCTPQLQGTLQEMNFALLLHQLHGLRASGVLMVEGRSRKKKKAIEFRDGYPVAVKSNLVTECLGNMLVHWGELTEDALEESISRVKRGEGLQGEILVAMEVLDEESIAAALRRQAEAKLFDLFGWRRGRFQFKVDGKLQKANSLALDANPANIILEGARKHISLRQVDELFAGHGERFLVEGDSPFYRFQSVDLSAADEQVISSLDGHQTLGMFADASESVRRTIYGLLVTELLTLKGDASSAPRQAPVETPVTDSVDESELRAELTRMAQTMRGQAYWEVLGLTTTASGDQIREAYEDLSRRFHPDRFHNSSGAVRRVSDEIYDLISRAFDAMTDPKQRAGYTRSQKQGSEDRGENERAKRALAAETSFQQGEAALRARRYEEALMAFGQALQQYPDEGEYHAHYGWCLHLFHPDDMTLIREAIEHVQRGIKLARDRDKPYLFLGRLYTTIGKLSAAEKMFTRAVQIRPDGLEAMRELRLLNMRREKGKGIFKRLLRR